MLMRDIFNECLSRGDLEAAWDMIDRFGPRIKSLVHPGWSEWVDDAYDRLRTSV